MPRGIKRGRYKYRIQYEAGRTVTAYGNDQKQAFENAKPMVNEKWRDRIDRPSVVTLWVVETNDPAWNR